MRNGLWQRIERHGFGGAAGALSRLPFRLVETLRMPAPDSPKLLNRITIMERNIVLPIKAAGILMLLYFFLKPWTAHISETLDVANDAAKSFFWVYVGVNVGAGFLLLQMRRLPQPLVEWIVFAIGLVDGIFLSSLTLVTGGYNSALYYLFLALIIRSAVSVPRALSQLALNLTLSACYVLAGFIDVAVAQDLDTDARGILRIAAPSENPAEPLLLRLVLLLLMTVCCYGLQVLLDRQQRVVEEAREFALREGQLHAAGRLAAEFAHQIKNPLAIINNAAFSLRRALKTGASPDEAQLQIIQEEVERSDRIITQIMGYAQLSEGRVEKLNVIEELEQAIAEVFPPAARYPVEIHRKYAQNFPPLLMHRRHLSETFGNLLQNAREALNGHVGNVFVSAGHRDDYSIEVEIRDDGPGIPADKHERVFEAYYTTKEKGTGLGLATVKHNVELYGGTVRLESELGKGARFTLVFPARTQINLARST